MKLLFISLFALSLFSAQAQFNSQVPDVKIPLFVSFDSLPYPPPYNGDSLFIGIDSIATDSLDEIFGEINLPSIPPPGWPSFLILPYNDFGSIISHSDFREGSMPYTGVKEYRIKFCSQCGATIHWQLPVGVTGLLQDIIGGAIINEHISGIDSIYVPSTGLYFLKLFLTFNNYIPVELTSFTANISDNSINLNWCTSTETNNSGFQIQRRKPIDERSEEWNTIGFVSGNGTTTEPQSYSFVDENLSSGRYKYRLKQIDYDGTFTYLPNGQPGSNEIEVEIAPSEFALEQNYPNPFNPSTSIHYAIGSLPTGQAGKQFVTLKVYDVLGNEIATLVNEEKPAGSYQVELYGSKLSSGVYYYKLNSGDFIQTKKMMFIK